MKRSTAFIEGGLREPLRGLVGGVLPWPLFLYGRPGLGKTCAALCLLDYAGGDYFKTSGLCALLIQCQQGRLEWSHDGRRGVIWPEEFWRRLRKQPLVVLDEIGGRDKVSDHHYEAVKEVLDERIGRPLVVISNHGLAEIGQLYDDRVASRLSQGTVIELAGQDRRQSR